MIFEQKVRIASDAADWVAIGLTTERLDMAVTSLRPGDPERIGPYRLDGRLGEGGQGVVYLASAENGGRVAVKTIKADIAAEPQTQQRFAREVAAATRVPSHCTARVLDFDLTGSPRYIASEFVDGRTLEEAGRQLGDDLFRLAIATATALTAIHGAGVVHRDFKPSNVIIGSSGIRVIDFGIAREVAGGSSLTHGGAIGTPLYMAPEQIEGRQVTTAVDLFAWGTVIAYAATGTPPFAAGSVTGIFNRILREEPDLSALPEELRGLVAECLSKDPARRPAAPAVLMRLLGGTADLGGALEQGTRIATSYTSADTQMATGLRQPSPPGPPGGNWGPPPRPPMVRTVSQFGGPPPYYGPPRRGRGKVLGCLVPLGVVVVAGLIAAGVLIGKNAADNTPKAAVPAGLAGSWMGVLHATGSGGGYSDLYTLSLSAGRRDGGDVYELGQCHGKVVPQRNNNGTLSLNERYSQPNRQNCSDTSLEVSARPGDRLAIVIFDPNTPGQADWTGQLSPEPKAGPPRLSNAFTGTWTGTMNDEPMTLNLNNVQSGLAGTIVDGDGISCSVVPVATGPRSATLLAGGTNCESAQDTGTYQLTLNGAAHMTVRFRDSDGQQNLTGTATSAA
jgi:predicted Ser/Thr protein kinase